MSLFIYSECGKIPEYISGIYVILNFFVGDSGTFRNYAIPESKKGPEEEFMQKVIWHTERINYVSPSLFDTPLKKPAYKPRFIRC